MNKIKLTLGEIQQLENEINGFIKLKTGEIIYEGFLKQNLSIILKYELKELSIDLLKEKSKIDELRDELIKKYGEVDADGGLSMNMFLEERDSQGAIVGKRINPKWPEFDKEYTLLLRQEKEINYPDITIDDLKKAGDTKDDYQVLFKLVKK
jgi:hypothetical protein